MRIIGSSAEMDFLTSLTENTAWAYPILYDLVSRSSLEIDDNMIASKTNAKVSVPSTCTRCGKVVETQSSVCLRDIGIMDIPALFQGETVCEDCLASPEEAPTESDTDSQACSAPTTSPVCDRDITEDAISHLVSIGAKYDEAKELAINDCGQAFSVFIQKEGESADDFCRRNAYKAFEDAGSALFVACDRDMRLEVIRLIRLKIGNGFYTNGDAWFVCDVSVPWSRSFIESGLHLNQTSPTKASIAGNIRAAILIAANQYGAVNTPDSLREMLSGLRTKVEDALGESSVPAAKELLQQIAGGVTYRNVLPHPETIEKLINLGVLDNSNLHQVFLTPVGVAVAKIWNPDMSLVRQSAGDSWYVMEIAKALTIVGEQNAYVYGDAVVVTQGETIAVLYHIDDAYNEEAVAEIAKSSDHVFIVTPMAGGSEEYEEMANRVCEGKCAGVWTLSEIRKNPKAPVERLLAFRAQKGDML